MTRQGVGHGLVVATIMTIAALAVLVSLGFWQLDRMAWKEALIASIEAGLKAEPVVIGDPQTAADMAHAEYRPVVVTGRFLHAEERHLFAAGTGAIGWHIYTPLEVAGRDLVLVNRGFVPHELKDPARRLAGQVEGKVSVTGLVRKPGQKGWFDADPDLKANAWYWRDLAGMAAPLGDERAKRILPFFVDAAAEPANAGGWPQGGVTRLAIPNRHFEYALTWFGLAGALAAVYAGFAWSRLRGMSSRA